MHWKLRIPEHTPAVSIPGPPVLVELVDDAEETSCLLAWGDNVKRPWYHVTFEEKAALVSAIGGITFGYDIGVISGALVTLADDFQLRASAEGATQ